MTADAVPGPVDALLLALFAAPDADHGAALSRLGEGEWLALYERIEAERGEVLLRRAAARAGVATPAPIAAWLAAAERSRTVAALRQAEALRRLFRVLEGDGLSPIALKGVRLAWATYPSPALRPMRDLDLLLPRAEVERAEAALLAAPAYVRPGWAGRYGVEYGHQLPEILDQERDVVIELHHRLNARGWQREPRLVALIAATSETIDIGGQAIRVPSAHANLLHLAGHATLHHLFDNGPAVLADLHFIAASGEIDWPVLRGQAEEMGLARALRLLGAIAARHGATWLPAAGIDGDAPSPEQVAAGEAALVRSDAQRRQLAFLRRLETRTSAAPGPRAAVRAMLRPGAAALAQIAGTDPASPMRWLAYPAWALRRLGTYRAARRARAEGESSRQVRLLAWLHGR